MFVISPVPQLVVELSCHFKTNVMCCTHSFMFYSNAVSSLWCSECIVKIPLLCFSVSFDEDDDELLLLLFFLKN